MKRNSGDVKQNESSMDASKNEYETDELAESTEYLLNLVANSPKFKISRLIKPIQVNV